MARSITIGANKSHIHIGGQEYNAGQTITISDEVFAGLRSALFSDGTLIDNGVIGTGSDTVYVQGAHINLVGALTSAPSASAPTKAEFDKVVADVVTLRTALNAALTALEGVGKALA